MTAQQKWRVLLVDDTADLRLLTRVALERTGRFEIVGEAGNGREGIELAESLRPDMVVLDLDMPVMSGYDALPQILAASPRSQIVVFSGIAGEAEDEGMPGVAGFVLKGTAIDTLVARLTEILEAA